MAARSRTPPRRLSEAAERRRTRRRKPRDTRLTSAALPVRLLDLSDEGMAIESRVALRIGATYPFTLRGDPVAGGAFRGKVLWCRLARTEKGEDGDIHAVYRAGVRRLEGD